MAAEIFPGAPIRTGATIVTEGTLGVVVRDTADKRFYAVTARNLFRVDDQPALTSSKKRIGKPTERFDRDREPREPAAPVIDLVGFFEVDKALDATDQHPGWDQRITATVPAASVVGERLYTLRRDAPPLPTVVVGYGVPFDFEDDSGRERVIEGGLEVASADGDEPHGRPGDAGAPVVTQDGRLVGVVVALGEASSIVAPVHEVFEAHGLEVFLRQMKAEPRPPQLVGQRSRYADTAEPTISGNPRIAGVSLPGRKRIVIALQYIYGIGRYTAEQVCNELNISFDIRANALTNAHVLAIREYIDQNLMVEGDLRREVAVNIKRLTDLACYRGLRHRKGLPVRGQRTHTNARTRKGPAISIAGKKK